MIGPMHTSGRLLTVSALIVACSSGEQRTPSAPMAPKAPSEAAPEQPHEIAEEEWGDSYVIGDLCLNRSLSRMNLFPRFRVSGDRWSAEAGVVRAPLLAASHKFTALGLDGSTVAVFLTETDPSMGEMSGFVGEYRGSSGGCSAGDAEQKVGDWACIAAGGCGLAVSRVGEPVSPRWKMDISTAFSCVENGVLVLDINGDGVDEAFDLAAFAEQSGLEAESAETAAVVRGRLHGRSECEREFIWYQLKRGPSRAVDVLGVVDLNGDGRHELVIAVRGSGSRSIAVYQARDDGLRLDRVAVANSEWPFEIVTTRSK